MKKWKLGLLGVMVTVFIGLFAGSSEANAWDIHYSCWNVGHGWTDAYDGGVAGIPNKSSTMTDFWLETNRSGMYIEYRAHLQTKGWTKWVREGTRVGEDGKRIEALHFRIGGDLTAYFTDLKATPHLQTYGWIGSNISDRNGYGMIGTIGEYRRLEALKLELI